MRLLLRFPLVALTAALAAAPGRAGPLVHVPFPADLPRYKLDLKIDPPHHTAEFRIRITWTNRCARPTDKMVFNFYPHYRIPGGEYLLLAKTLELLRLNPSQGIDRQGGHGKLQSVSLVDADPTGAERVEVLSYTYRPDNPTALSVDLPRTVRQGESVTVELVGSIWLPEKQGRWGHWKGVTYLEHALPQVAFYDADGWKEIPFVPWHQPFWNEAGVYTTTVTLRSDQVLGCGAEVHAEEDLGGGWKKVVCEPFVGRDFSLVCSSLYKEYRSSTTLPDGRVVALRCVAYPEHEFYANELLKLVGEAIPVYSRWFGPFPYSQFTVAESYFGWNGNECSGMILIDERVFGMPHLGAGYVEYLVSHETCHQWWYNLVGTNGYSETFMDEAMATHFTHKLLDQKKGKNNELLEWPDGFKWIPNIKRDNYRWGSLVGAIARDQAPAAAGDLPQFGHLFALFSGAYDRGSKAVGMIEAQLGDEWLPFMQMIVRKYSFDVISADTYRKELEAFTGRPWDDFFKTWIYGKKVTDWSVEAVKIEGRAGPLQRAVLGEGTPPGGGRRVEVVVRQAGELDAPTTLEFQYAGGGAVRVPIGPSTAATPLPESGGEVRPLGGGRALVVVNLPQEPVQVIVDPDRLLVDANPGNNQWKNPPAVHAIPLYSILNETDLTNDYDRWNFAAGPWVWGPTYPDPWYTRSTMLGVRAGAYRTQQFSGGVYAALRSDYRDLVVGADGLVDHFPWPRSQLGFNVEERVGGPYFGSTGQSNATRASVYERYIFKYGSSLYLPPISFVDVYAAYTDNFLPFQRDYTPGAVRPNYTYLTGARYRLNLYTPYWDPETGAWIDAWAAGGVAGLGGQVGIAEGKAELAAAQKLPDGFGYWSNVKLAGRAVVEAASAQSGQFFALGGGTLFRGFDLAQRQGSFLWVANAEVRFPVYLDRRWDALDHVAGVRNVHIAGFYDVGEVYDNGHTVGGAAHALGAGLRVDLAIFSFIERATVRLDAAKTINAATGMQFWFGVQHPF